MRIPIGTAVAWRMQGSNIKRGATAAGPHRASRGYLWVLWDGEAFPRQANRAFVVCLDRAACAIAKAEAV